GTAAAGWGRGAGSACSRRSPHVSHELLDGVNVLGELRHLGAQLGHVAYRLFGQLAVGSQRHRVRAVPLQPVVVPDDHRDRGADRDEDRQQDADRRVAGAGRGQRCGVCHWSLSSMWSASLSSSSASARTTVSAVTRTSKGTSSKYFIALPSSDSSSCPDTRPAFSSRSRCMYSSGLDMPSLRASSLTCTRPPASSAMICSRSGCAIAVSMATSSSLVRVSSTLFHL